MRFFNSEEKFVTARLESFDSLTSRSTKVRSMFRNDRCSSLGLKSDENDDEHLFEAWSTRDESPNPKRRENEVNIVTNDNWLSHVCSSGEKMKPSAPMT